MTSYLWLLSVLKNINALIVLYFQVLSNLRPNAQGKLAPQGA